MADDGKVSIEEFAQSVKAKYPQYKDVDNYELAGAMLKKYPQYLDQVQTSRPRKSEPSYSLLTQPKEYLQQRSQKLAQSAQQEKYKAEGPESAGKSMPSRLGHELLSLAPETGAMVDKTIAGMLDPKTAAAIGAGAVDPAIPAAYFMTQGTGSLAGIGGQPSSVMESHKSPTPENVQKVLTDLSMVVGGASAAKAPTSGSAIPIAKQGLELGKEVVGKTARNYAEKVSREMTGLLPEKKTGVDIPARVAESTREITKLKNAGDVYNAKAVSATAEVERLAGEAKTKGVALTPQETGAVYTMMDKLYKRSGAIKQMEDFGQLKSPLWSGQRPGYIDPQQMLELRRDLDEVINYDSRSGKQTPVGKAAHDVRTALDKTLDNKVPGWQDTNERSSALIKASKALQDRYEQSFTKYLGHGIMSVLRRPGSLATFIAGYEGAAQIPGMPHIGQYITGIAASTMTRFLYDSLPSQTARIAFADSLADKLIGPRAPKGPSSYPSTIPPGRQIGAPQPPRGPFTGPGGSPIAPAGMGPGGPLPVGGGQPQAPGNLPGGQPQAPLSLGTGTIQLPGQVQPKPAIRLGSGSNLQDTVLSGNQGTSSSAQATPPPPPPQAVNTAAAQAFREAAAKTGMKPEEIEKLIVQSMNK